MFFKYHAPLNIWCVLIYSYAVARSLYGFKGILPSKILII